MTTTSPIPMRITIKGEPRAGRMVQVILSIGHPMESGFRTLDSGNRVPKNVIEKITVRLGERVQLIMDTGIGISAHPYLVFPLFLPQDFTPDMLLQASWADDRGQTGSLSRALA